MSAAGDSWANARTMSDLCGLTERWLLGLARSQPSYPVPVDVDEGKAPGLTGTLVALNRSGYLTDSSTAGFDGTGYDGVHWRCHAAVSGFAATATVERITKVLRGTRFKVISNPLHRGWRRRFPGVPATVRENVVLAVSGRQLSAQDVADIYDGCHQKAIDAVCSARRVTVYDPRPGSNDLWFALRDAAAGPPGGMTLRRRMCDRGMGAVTDAVLTWRT